MNFKKFNGTTWETVQHKIYGSGADSLTAFPAVIQASGDPLTDYTISGNTVQNGTPTPSDPVDVQGCGERTGNLLDESVASDADATHINYNKSVPILLTAGQTYTFSCDTACNGLYIRSAVDDSNLAIANDSATLTYTPQVNVGVYCRIWNSNGIANLKPMLNIGSTALPYEPYGYKLPITVNGTEYPIYLGQVEATRRIKKSVLDGTEEGWEKSIQRAGCFALRDFGTRVTEKTMYCTHATYVSTASELASNNTCYMGRDLSIWLDLFDAQTTIEQFKSYLAAQYAAGTPVTIWYVLATPETAVVNEPLHKIGGYADTITMAQAEVAIPTSDGDNAISFGTPVQPSAMSATFKGWHPVQAAKTYDGSEWR